MQPICSPALTPPILFLDTRGFHILVYYNYLLQVYVKPFLQLVCINPASGSHKNGLYSLGYSLSLLSHLLWTQVARTWEGHFCIDSKAYVTILKVTSWVSYGFGTTNKIPSTVLMAKVGSRPSEVEGTNHERCGSVSASLLLQIYRVWVHRRHNVFAWLDVHLYLMGKWWDWEQPSHVLLEAEHPKPQLFWQLGCMEDRQQLSQLSSGPGLWSKAVTGSWKGPPNGKWKEHFGGGAPRSIKWKNPSSSTVFTRQLCSVVSSVGYFSSVYTLHCFCLLKAFSIFLFCCAKHQGCMASWLSSWSS